jgi:hypothetical protein
MVGGIRYSISDGLLILTWMIVLLGARVVTMQD